MSYIEKKYYQKIIDIFNILTDLDKETYSLLKEKSIRLVDEFARLCAAINRQVNLILKNYYPEIKEMTRKLEIKSKLKFYFNLIDKLTDLIRHVENFEKIDDKYFEEFAEFLLDKDELVFGKYTEICRQELTAFYNQKSRDALEAILSQTLDSNNRNYFTMGPLEEEIKKIAKIEGAREIYINLPTYDILEFCENAQSIIEISVWPNDDLAKKKQIMDKIVDFLRSKKYFVNVIDELIVTDARLLSDP
ncbi:MAG: hypothetical protein JW891_03820 [Candidatus Lokiarchaeota archaeon]|nr:hypothetical protein [Candidatus Lokiarchaeota archaeon]